MKRNEYLNFNPNLFLSSFDMVEPNEQEKNVSYKMKERLVPYSLTKEEGDLIYSFVKKHSLKRGFEIATGFGVSTMYLGNALKEIGGTLVSCDAYIEETQESDQYTDVEDEVAKIVEGYMQGKIPLGLQYAKKMVEIYGLDSTVKFIIGLSPQDVTKESVGEIDFAYIDGGHHGEQPTIDVKSALSLMTGEHKSLIFHDNHVFGTPVRDAVAYASQELGVYPQEFRTKYNLTIVSTLSEI